MPNQPKRRSPENPDPQVLTIPPKLTFVRICTHYFAHAAWLQDGQLLRDAHHLKDIPGVLIDGRLDLSGPLLTAWELAQAWPEAELMIIEDSGHTGSPAMRKNAVLDAIAKFDPALPCFQRNEVDHIPSRPSARTLSLGARNCRTEELHAPTAANHSL
jgi:hypothetical protein